MITQQTRSKYTTTIGIECHVQLKTATKLFSGVSNDARGARPNTLISHICLGMPGALPVLNQKVVEFASRVAFAFGVEPQKYSYFERKHYFYPDLPKGYQITQLNQPIVVGGNVNIMTQEGEKTVRINRVQIEEDAGKSTHPPGKDYSLVDLNRAGTPLLEIVSEPDMHSAEEAKAYARELYLLMRYTDVSDADMYHGNMRFDVNVSVSTDSGKLGTRTETKNLNSFRSVEKAVDYEIGRQMELLEKGESIVQETRGWHDDKQKTFSQRTKEEAHDYRYFPDPDLPPVVLDEAMIESIKAAMPVMPGQWRERLQSLGLDSHQTEVLIGAEASAEDVNYLPLIEARLNKTEEAKFFANYFVNTEIPLRKSAEQKVNISNDERSGILSDIYGLTSNNKLSSTNAKALYEKILTLDATPENVEKYADQQGLLQLSDTGEIEKIVAQVIAENPSAAKDVQSGEAKAIGFLVGQAMKLSKGQANPQVLQELIRKQLKVA